MAGRKTWGFVQWKFWGTFENTKTVCYRW